MKVERRLNETYINHNKLSKKNHIINCIKKVLLKI
jgi:hypothetical protein